MKRMIHQKKIHLHLHLRRVTRDKEYYKERFPRKCDLRNECEAAEITKRYHVRSEDNLSDGLTKPLNPSMHYNLYKDGGRVFCKAFSGKSNTK